jgi:hypothetical protein
MSYPLTCAAGYPNPLREGKFEITQMRATVLNPAVSARITLIDDAAIKVGDRVGKIYADDYLVPGSPRVIDTKLDANTGGDVDVIFGESLKLRHGLSVVNCTNIVSGSLCVFGR